MIQTGISPGIVAAFIFILFDIIVLAVVDFLLIHAVCHLYYRNINTGSSTEVKSLAIPGVVTNLLGSFRSLTNCSALLVKVILVAAVFLVNLDVNNELIPIVKPKRLQAVYEFNASQAEWDGFDDRSRAVTRREEFTRVRCSVRSGENYTFYQPAFNLTGSVTLQDEKDFNQGIGTQYLVDHESLTCLTPDVVENPRPLMKVVNCSHFGYQGCEYPARYELNVTLRQDLTKSRNMTMDFGAGKFPYTIIEYNQDDVREAFPEYDNPKMYCLEQCRGLFQSCCNGLNEGNCSKNIRTCNVVARNSTHTILEKWIVERQEGVNVVLVRNHPGPVMEGSLEIGKDRAVYLLACYPRSFDWWVYAGLIMTKSYVYRYIPTSYSMKDSVGRTVIPTYSIVLGTVILFIVVVACIVYCVTLMRDERPRFNTVNGLSSILREELYPTGNSLREGGLVAVFGVKDADNKVRFKPL